MAINIQMQGLDVAFASIDKKVKLIERGLKEEMDEWAKGTALRAKQLAPTDEGHLKGAINPNFVKDKQLKVSVTVAVNYAAYIEFGTKKYAAAYVSTLPSDWKTFAAEFKGKGSGDYFDFLNNILDWVIRKGIANRYSVKTKRKINIKLGSGSSDENRLEETAYAIALSILRKGVKPQPYLYPAVKENNKKLIDNLKNLFK